MLSASSEFILTGKGGIWLIIPGIDIILHEKKIKKKLYEKSLNLQRDAFLNPKTKNSPKI